MKHSPFVSGVLSLLVPGLGQIYAGEKDRGAAIIVGAIIVANLNVIILPVISLANPTGPAGVAANTLIWRYWIPRVAHDVASFWSIVFWIWAIVDAIIMVKKNRT